MLGQRHLERQVPCQLTAINTAATTSPCPSNPGRMALLLPPGRAQHTELWSSHGVRPGCYTSVSIRSRSIRLTLHSTATRLVMGRAQAWGNQPRSPSRSRSPQHQPGRRMGCEHTWEAPTAGGLGAAGAPSACRPSMVGHGHRAHSLGCCGRSTEAVPHHSHAPRHRPPLTILLAQHQHHISLLQGNLICLLGHVGTGYLHLAQVCREGQNQLRTWDRCIPG